MSKSIKNILDENNIKFSKLWDPKVALDFFSNATPEDIHEELPFSASGLKNFLAKTFPNKPPKMSITKYTREILAIINEPDLEDTFNKIYKLGVPFRKGAISKLSTEVQEQYSIYATNRKTAEDDETAYNKT